MRSNFLVWFKRIYDVTKVFDFSPSLKYFSNLQLGFRVVSASGNWGLLGRKDFWGLGCFHEGEWVVKNSNKET